MSVVVSFVLSFFPRDVLDEILNLIESVSEDFPSYSSSHLVQAFCTGEPCFTRVSIKLLPHYTLLENKLVEGEARKLLRPLNDRKSSFT